MAKYHNVLAFALLSAFAAAPAFAGGNTPVSDTQARAEHIPPFDQIDSDGSGMLDKDEFARGTTNQVITLAQVDTDGDGKVSRNEWDTHKKMKKELR
jgi:EF hand